MNRREVLRGIAAAGSTAIVTATAGCGGSDTTPTSAPAETDGTAPSGPDGDDGDSDGGDSGSTATTDTPLATAVVANVFDFESADDGHLVVTVPVENRAGDRRTRTVVVSLTVDGESYERSTDVTLDAGESTTAAVDFPSVDLADAGTIDASVSIEE